MTDLTPASTSRRSVLKTAAWSVPAVTVASAAPAFADSGTVELVIDGFTGLRTINGTNIVRINQLGIANSGSGALLSKQLVITITWPEHWGDITGWHEGDAGQPEPTRQWSFTPGANSVTITSIGEEFTLAAGAPTVDLLALGLDWAWTVTGDGGSTLGDVTITVGALTQRNVVGASSTRRVSWNAWV